MSARIELQIYGPTKESASDAALAYCEELVALHVGGRVALGNGVTIVGADNIEGPQWVPDGEEPRYIVDVDLLFN